MNAIAPTGHVLIVDDEPNFCRILRKVVTEAGHTVTTAESATEALRIMDQEHIDVVVTDLRMPGMDGLELLRRMRADNEELAVIVMTAFGSFQTAMDATSAGAFEYITKPFENAELVRKINNAVERRQLVTQRQILTEKLESSETSQIIGRSTVMQQVGQLIAKVAPTNSTVLITGASGTGKELVARAIHRNSLRARQALVTVNCGAIPHDLLENELFGHEKGAFTSADRTHSGLMDKADGGTLFLDEIGEIPLELQSKLLRMIETGEYRRVGGLTDRRADLRILAATNRSLVQMVEQGKFRSDLYYRLAAVPIQLPPLTKRREDIPLLVENLLARGRREGRTFQSVDPEAMRCLQAYDWPGNVRELENVIERILISRNHTIINIEDLPPEMRGESVPGTVGETTLLSYKKAKIVWETRYFKSLLQAHDYNITHSAQTAGLSRRHLQEKLKELGIRISDHP